MANQSNDRDSWHWQESGTAWKGVTPTRRTRYPHALMPDHFHGILYVKEQMPVSILSVVRGFWQGCKRVANTFVTANTIRPNERTNILENVIRDNKRRDKETIRPNERTNILENVIRDNSPLFTEKPFVRVMSRSGQLQTMIRYVQLNPHRATVHVHKELLFDACAEGRVLFLAPTQRDDSKKVILRSECVQLNGIADEIAAEGA